MVRHGVGIVIGPIVSTTVIALLLALPGLFLVVHGVMLNVNRRVPWGNRFRIAHELATWYENGTFQTEAQFNEVWWQLRSLAGWAMAGAGLGWLLGVGALFLGVLTLPGSERGVLVSVQLPLLILIQGASLGFTLGYVLGSTNATHKPPHAPTYGDLRPRRASDYFATWLPWVPVGVSLEACAVLALLASQYDSITLQGPDATWTLSTRIILCVFAATALAINGVGLTCIRWIALSPRTLLSSNAQVARGADNYRRAVGIGGILQLTSISSGYLLMSAANIVTMHGALIGHSSLIASVFDYGGVFLYVLCVPVVMFGTFLVMCQGRIGGTLTGWRNPLRLLAFA